APAPAAVLYVSWEHIGLNPKYKTPENNRDIKDESIWNSKTRQLRVDCIGASKGLFIGLFFLTTSFSVSFYSSFLYQFRNSNDWDSSWRRGSLHFASRLHSRHGFRGVVFLVDKTTVRCGVNGCLFRKVII
ncbi:Uncharacterized protein APZ42_001314, partial [Daphnia magna]